jgi:hypothetical protein
MSTVVPVTGLANYRSHGRWFARHWFMSFAIIYGLWVWLPFAAPVFMHAGWSGAGRMIYLVYSFFCHQVPERSLFLFGSKLMCSLAEIQAGGRIHRTRFRWRFIGSESMG